MDNAKKVYDYVITKFLSSYMYLRSNEGIKSNKPPNIQKSYWNNLKKYYLIIENELENGGVSSEEEDEYNPF